MHSRTPVGVCCEHLSQGTTPSSCCSEQPCQAACAEPDHSSIPFSSDMQLWEFVVPVAMLPNQHQIQRVMPILESTWGATDVSLGTLGHGPAASVKQQSYSGSGGARPWAPSLKRWGPPALPDCWSLTLQLPSGWALPSPTSTAMTSAMASHPLLSPIPSHKATLETEPGYSAPCPSLLSPHCPPPL